MKSRTEPPERPRHKKKAVRGSVPIYCRLDPESDFAKWSTFNPWSVWKRYRDEQTASTTIKDLERKHTSWQFALEKPA